MKKVHKVKGWGIFSRRGALLDESNRLELWKTKREAVDIGVEDTITETVHKVEITVKVVD